MSEELEVRITSSGKEVTILARHTEFGGKVWNWVLEEGQPHPETVAQTYVHNTTKPRPNFFEEKANYQGPHSGLTHTVHHVHEMAAGLVALTQTINGTPILLTQEDWRSGLYVKVR